MNGIEITTALATANGALAAADAVIVLFFLRFWRRTGDRLFAFFAVAFGLLTVQRVTLGLMREWSEGSPLLYGLRLLAFLIILAAIIDKNRAGGRS